MNPGLSAVNFCESEAGSLQFVAKKVTTCYGLNFLTSNSFQSQKCQKLLSNIFILVNIVGISTVLFMELPVANTLLLGSIPNSAYIQLQSIVKVECCASLINKGF